MPHKPREPVRIETSDNRYHCRNKLREAIGKYCGQTVGAIKMNSIYKANLLLHIIVFFKELRAPTWPTTTRSSTRNFAMGMLALVRYCWE